MTPEETIAVARNFQIAAFPPSLMPGVMQLMDMPMSDH
jgi:hypothetical protein